MLRFLIVTSLLGLMVQADFDECTENDLCQGEGNFEALNARYPSLAGARLPSVTFKTHLYFFNRYKTVTWMQALDFCRRFNMFLVSIESEEEHNFLVSQAQSLVEEDYMGYWTSGNDLATNGTYVWSSNGEKFQYQKWHDGNPSFNSFSGKESCVLLYRLPDNDWKWNDSICMHHQYFICENLAVGPAIEKIEPPVQSEKKNSKSLTKYIKTPALLLMKYPFLKMKS